MRCTAPPENMLNMPRMPLDWPLKAWAKAWMLMPGDGDVGAQAIDDQRAEGEPQPLVQVGGAAETPRSSCSPRAVQPPKPWIVLKRTGRPVEIRQPDHLRDRAAGIEWRAVRMPLRPHPPHRRWGRWPRSGRRGPRGARKTLLLRPSSDRLRRSAPSPPLRGYSPILRMGEMKRSGRFRFRHGGRPGLGQRAAGRFDRGAGAGRSRSRRFSVSLAVTSPWPSRRTPSSSRRMTPAAFSSAAPIGAVTSSLPASIALGETPQVHLGELLGEGVVEAALGHTHVEPASGRPRSPSCHGRCARSDPSRRGLRSLPLPEPSPRPTRMRFLRAPSLSAISFSFMACSLRG